ncbi:MAG TPA: T9SS type A sorting domain-containing protein, partial [Bacteroidia bacterium]|nr:T9SS type A sorting domain-containing protein [Bacteroidia bacterium]
NKDLGKWKFRTANVDGTDDHTDSVMASNANAKLLDYYDVVNKTWINREPDSLKDWDLVWTRYHEWLFNQYLPVMGVLSNKDVLVAQVKPVNTATFDFTTLTAGDYKYEKNIIGSDWKQFDPITFSWSIEDSTLYFVKTRNGAIWKMEFTGFTPSGNRISYFNKTKMTPAMSANPVATVKTFGVFPNPASSNISLVFENADNSVSSTLKIFDLTGKMIESHNLESAPGFYANSLDIAHLPTGVYVVTLENGGYSLSQKLVKQ